MRKVSTLACLTLLALFPLLVESCKDAEPQSGPGPTKVELLTREPWIYKSTRAKLKASDLWQDLPFQSGNTTLSEPAPCSTDDIHTYLANGTYTIAGASQKCEQAEFEIIYTSTWQLSADGGSLQVGSTLYTITTIDIETLQYESQIGAFYVQSTYRH